MTDLRLLEAHEVPLLLPRAREFFAEGRIDGALNEAYFVQELSRRLLAQVAFVLVCGQPPFRGAICGVIFQDLATAERCCMEYFWYVAKEERGTLGLRLLVEGERIARERGARRLLMGHHWVGDAVAIENVFKRRSYQPREQIWARDLGEPKS